MSDSNNPTFTIADATKTCRYCSTQIPKGAKICPNCKKKQVGSKKTVIIVACILVVLLVIIAALGSGDKGNDTQKIGEVTSDIQNTQNPQADSKDSTDSESTTQADTKTAYAVGDILQDGNTKIVYVASGVYHESNQFMQPDEGKQYIFLKFSIENTGKTTDTSISSFSFQCYADGYSADSYYGGENGLSATLSPGKTTEGCVYFTVPVDAKEIEIEYEANVFTDKKIKFLYEGEKDSGYQVSKEVTASENAYHVGDVVKSERLSISYLSCKEYVSDNQFIQPKDGYRFVTLRFAFENTGKSDELISAASFDCYADGVACETSYVGNDQLSATLSAGRKTEGNVTFEVPVDAKVIEAEFLSNYWTSNRVIFEVAP